MLQLYPHSLILLSSHIIKYSLIQPVTFLRVIKLTTDLSTARRKEGEPAPLTDEEEGDGQVLEDF